MGKSIPRLGTALASGAESNMGKSTVQVTFVSGCGSERPDTFTSPLDFCNRLRYSRWNCV